jgi:hypothetical protein
MQEEENDNKGRFTEKAETIYVNLKPPNNEPLFVFHLIVLTSTTSPSSFLYTFFRYAIMVQSRNSDIREIPIFRLEWRNNRACVTFSNSAIPR